MRYYYFLIVSIVVLSVFGTVSGLLLVLYSMGVLRRVSFALIVSVIAASTSASALMSYFVGRRILTPMLKLSKASKEVAHGNFNVTVSDSSRLEEVQSTFRNFNAMVKELDAIATLSNDFVANVSHEFKTPLTAIEGYAMLLQDPSLPREEHEAYVEKILYNTHRLTTLISNILMLSKMENKQLAEQHTEFRLDEQIRQAVVSLEGQWEQKDIRFAISMDRIVFRGCEGLLMHVWSNLIDNAIKFSAPGAIISIGLLDQKECVVFSVQDQGIGMQPEVQEHIFEKFYQGDTSHRSQGNGLGLALVKRIVELSEGIIEVDSTPEQGSTFRVILPKP